MQCTSHSSIEEKVKRLFETPLSAKLSFIAEQLGNGEKRDVDNTFSANFDYCEPAFSVSFNESSHFFPEDGGWPGSRVVVMAGGKIVYKSTNPDVPEDMELYYNGRLIPRTVKKRIDELYTQAIAKKYASL